MKKTSYMGVLVVMACLIAFTGLPWQHRCQMQPLRPRELRPALPSLLHPAR